MVTKKELDKVKAEWEAAWCEAAEPDDYNSKAWDVEEAAYEKYQKVKQALKKSGGIMSKENIRGAVVLSCLGATIAISFSGNEVAFYSATMLTLALAFIAEKKGNK